RGRARAPPAADGRSRARCPPPGRAGADRRRNPPSRNQAGQPERPRTPCDDRIEGSRPAPDDPRRCAGAEPPASTPTRSRSRPSRPSPHPGGGVAPYPYDDRSPARRASPCRLRANFYSWVVVIVAHLDLDAFFAAVEQLEDPTLRRRPLVV